MPVRRNLLAATAVVAVVSSFVLPGSVARGASPDPVRRAALDVTGWRHATAAGAPTPDAGDGIGPGSYLLVERSDGTFICTANYVWTDTSATTSYLGAAGHCFLPADPVTGEPEDDVEAGSNQWVQRVQVCVSGCAFGGQLGAVFSGELQDLGEVVYARQVTGDADVGHDFGIVTIPTDLLGLVRPAMPVWGGPTGVDTIGAQVCHYGNAAVLGETFPTKARTGLGLFEEDGAWFAATPSFQGDSGSAVNNCDGVTGTTAVGILTHLTLAGVAGTTVARAIEMVQADLGVTLSVVTV